MMNDMVAKKVKMRRGADFLGSRARASSIIMDVERLLVAHPYGKIEADFSGISGMSHSFTDELLTGLGELLTSEMTSRVEFSNCGPRVQETIELVCDMHGLNLPQFSG